MQDHAFRLTDLHRFLFGNASWPFLIEVLIRTSATFVLLLVAMRLLGRRVAGQYTLFEISLVVTLAAAIGVPLQASNRGMIPPFLIVAVVIVVQRVLARAGARHRRLETLIATDVTLLVRDGQLDYSALRSAAMPREKIFEAMRIHGWQHLGQIGRLYMEPSGAFSFIPAQPPRPGLSVLPAIDDELIDESREQGWSACVHCGHSIECTDAADTICENCGWNIWTFAVTEIEK